MKAGFVVRFLSPSSSDFSCTCRTCFTCIERLLLDQIYEVRDTTLFVPSPVACPSCGLKVKRLSIDSDLSHLANLMGASHSSTIRGSYVVVVRSYMQYQYEKGDLPGVLAANSSSPAINLEEVAAGFPALALPILKVNFKADLVEPE
ncbi:hypothetical protein L596_028394 [Steinernema carpocapsae]|uniref:Uncharacterized protein n=1 Tax=Steinernema carpocapsae TaxID=34508 RepID=A0A4U5LYA3_STECR|nr:hypothetical protein L596_028394 [Steinernema carpocapsae]